MQNATRKNLVAVDDEAVPDVDRRTSWRRPLVFAGLAFFLIVAVAAGGYWLLVGRYLEETDDAYLKADTITVSPKIAGYVAEVLVVVRDNQQVAAGQVLTRIDDRDYRAELRSAAGLNEARAMLRTEHAALGVLESQRDKAKAAVDNADAAVEQSRLRLSYTTIAATQPGVVGDRAVRAGQLVQPGTRLMTLVPVRDIYLVANFKETQLGQLYRARRSTSCSTPSRAGPCAAISRAWRPGLVPNSRCCRPRTPPAISPAWFSVCR